MLRIWNFFKKNFCLFWFLLKNVKSESKNKFILYNICTYITPHLNSHNSFEWNLPLKIKTKYVVQTYVNSKYFLMSFNTELKKKYFSENIKNYQRILINKYYLMMHIIIVLRNVWMICLYTYMLFIRLYIYVYLGWCFIFYDITTVNIKKCILHNITTTTYSYNASRNILEDLQMTFKCLLKENIAKNK